MNLCFIEWALIALLPCMAIGAWVHHIFAAVEACQ